MRILPGALLVLMLSWAGCSAAASRTPTPSDDQPPLSTCGAVKVVVLLDKSHSAADARTADPEPGGLTPLVDLVARCGGEISVATIHDRRIAPFLRLRLSAPPSAPIAPVWSDNQLQRRRQRSAFRRVEEQHARAAQRWRTEVENRTAAFVSKLAAILEEPADAWRSPVLDAVRRADVLLGEPDPEWPDGRRWILAITDGIDNTRTRRTPISSSARLLVVNGLTSARSLDGYGPELFESLDAAVRVVLRESESSN